MNSKFMRRSSSLIIMTLLVSVGCLQIYDSVAEDALAPQNAELKIPKVIHQVWHAFNPKQPNPPEKLQEFAEEFKQNHPGWTYIYWTKEKSDAFVKTYYPDYYESFKSYPKEIQRADAIRYFALDHFGGVYADFDSQSLRNLEPLLRGFDAVVGEQSTFQHAIANGFMASVPKHPLWQTVFSELESSRNEPAGYRQVVNSTGPEMLTRAIHNYLGTASAKTMPVKVFGPKYFMPMTPDEVKTKGIVCRNSSDACRKLFPDAFSVEHWSNSW